ncbi:MAG: hypothetical protein RQ714_00715 [Nitrosomonas sp.]|nr:hypothetical protein [Nitrosomonas sp.]
MKKIFLILIGVLSGAFSTSATSSDPDTRHIIPLNMMQRHHLLSEMRALLKGTQAILQSLATQDMAALAENAHNLGVAMPHTGEQHLHGILPKAFVALGMNVHRGFDEIATEAETSQRAEIILQQLSDITLVCVDCHTTYQIRLQTSFDHKKSDTFHRDH